MDKRNESFDLSEMKKAPILKNRGFRKLRRWASWFKVIILPYSKKANLPSLSDSGYVVIHSPENNKKEISTIVVSVTAERWALSFRIHRGKNL